MQHVFIGGKEAGFSLMLARGFLGGKPHRIQGDDKTIKTTKVCLETEGNPQWLQGREAFVYELEGVP
ncbi:MAG: hypothetical protein ACKO37_04880 [Vampirovibrionales bacterium]